MPSEKTGDNEAQENPFKLEIYLFIYFFPARAVRHWIKLPTEVMGSQSLETGQDHEHTALADPALSMGLD